MGNQSATNRQLNRKSFYRMLTHSGVWFETHEGNVQLVE